MDLCAYRYEVDDPDTNNLFDILLTKMLMNFDVGSDTFTNL